jgi:hypothetical protein
MRYSKLIVLIFHKFTKIARKIQSEVADGVTSSPIAPNDEPKEDNEVSATTTEESLPASSDNSPQQSELRRRRVAALEIKTEAKSEK